MYRVIEWLKASKWKIFWIAVKVTAVIVAGGLLYGTITGYLSGVESDRIITDMQSDYDHISKRLEDSEGRVRDLTRIVGEVELRNSELGIELEESERIKRDLRRENTRIIGFINQSQVSTERLNDTNRLLKDSFGRIGNILDKYPIPIE